MLLSSQNKVLSAAVTWTTCSTSCYFLNFKFNVEFRHLVSFTARQTGISGKTSLISSEVNSLISKLQPLFLVSPHELGYSETNRCDHCWWVQVLLFESVCCYLFCICIYIVFLFLSDLWAMKPVFNDSPVWAVNPAREHQSSAVFNKNQNFNVTYLLRTLHAVKHLCVCSCCVCVDLMSQ